MDDCPVLLLVDQDLPWVEADVCVDLLAVTQ